ncbi:glycosyltransferase family 2 protein [Actinotalea caeni]|uniref:glycosyltransferase family 2 protein n=1 Tax=Actinotalea caeni TaxID=1348467 RepID=UPI001391212F|nr:glycosyltransferase [Actinotalea caeni]
MTVPALSVVIPAFDAEATLGEQLDAFARQRTTVPFEVLVCDNGSRDGTRALVRAREVGAPWLRLLDASARRGPAAARNVGARHAQAPLLAFADADDVVADDWVETMHAALEVDELVTGSLEGELLNAAHRASVSWTSEAVYAMPFMPRLRGASTNNLGVRRAVFEKVGGFHEDLRTSEDTDLCWRIQLAGHRLVEHPEIVLHVRKRDGVRAAFWQGYHYGVGDELLRARYLLVAAALCEQDESPRGDAAAPPSSASDRLRQLAERVGRFRGRVRWADHAFRAGHRWGSMRGRRAAREVVPLPVPVVLPRPDGA